MICKLAHTRDLDELPIKVTGKLYDNLFEFLIVLDNEYGENRDVAHDDGGYVLLCTPGTPAEEIKKSFDYSEFVPEWVDSIDHEPEYFAALFMVSTDYAVVLVAAMADLPVEIADAMAET